MRLLTAVKAATLFSVQGRMQVQEDFALMAPEKGIFAVSDGFGGSGAGDVAAKAACEALRSYLEKEAGDLDATLPFVLRRYYSLAGNVLFNAVIHANRKLLALNSGKNINEKGGASLLGAFLDGDLLALANVGACSALLFRGDRVAEIAVPRTYSRLMDPTGVSVDSRHQAPLMALGMYPDVEPEIFEVRVQSGDWVVLATDGVPEKQRDLVTRLRSETANGGNDPESSAEMLLKALKEESFEENSTAIVLVF